MSVYLTGDTHAHMDINKLRPNKWQEGQLLTRDDYLIILGDFGLVWDDSLAEHRALDWLEDMPWTTLFLDGNHENHDLLATFPEKELFGGLAHQIRPHVLHLMRGYVFDIPTDENTTASFAVMGGAASIDKEYREEGVSWWPNEVPSNDERHLFEKNLDARDWSVDYILTHDAPASIVPKTAMLMHLDNVVIDEFETWLELIQTKLNVKHWYFGHWHGDTNIDQLHTLLYHHIERLEN